MILSSNVKNILRCSVGKMSNGRSLLTIVLGVQENDHARFFIIDISYISADRFVNFDWLFQSLIATI